jgi:glycosyltransferase involved in cell wall biosynthesis
MKPKLKILFVHNALTTFVRIDRDLLAQEYAIDELYLKNKSQLNPLSIWKRVKANDLVFAWFASWHSFLPILFARWQGKPSILVAGGYDTAAVKEANYGNQLNAFSRLITNYTIRLASHIICNSDYTKKETIKVSGVKAKKIDVVYHGIAKEAVENIPQKENIILNVGNLGHLTIYRKGIKVFAQTAAFQEKYRFIQVGKWFGNKIRRQLPEDNSKLNIRGFVPDDELNNLYAKAKIYLQPSLHEGFGMSVAEAMRYGCVPVVSKYGALPEVVGDAGIVLEGIEPGTVAKIIENIDDSTLIFKSDLAQKRVEKMFLLRHRQAGLLCSIKKSYR